LPFAVDYNKDHPFDLHSFRQLPLPDEDAITRRWTGEPKPVVSIICATYNHRPYLEDALRGFLLQKTTFPFEVMLHDDASTDGTSNVVRAYAERYPRLIRATIRTRNQYSQGRRAAQFASEGARGNIFALCEGDDFWIDSEKLQLQASHFLADSSVTLVHSDYIRLFGERVIFPVHPLNAFPSPTREQMLELLLTRWNVMTATSAYRADVFRALLSANIVQKHWPFADYALALYATSNGRTVYLPRRMAVYRNTPGSVGNQGGRPVAHRFVVSAHECRSYFLRSSTLPQFVCKRIENASLIDVLKSSALAPDPQTYRSLKARLTESGGKIPNYLALHHFFLLRFRPYLNAVRVLQRVMRKLKNSDATDR
jgi:glycosyltransferase involved in cell wall biosynthesis